MNAMRELNRAELAQTEGGIDLGGVGDLFGLLEGGLSGLIQEFILGPILEVVNGIFNQIVSAITDLVSGLFGS